MLNIILLYALCLYFVAKAFKRSDDDLISAILVILIICLLGGFLYYCSIILALSAINWIGYIGLAIFLIYLGAS